LPSFSTPASFFGSGGGSVSSVTNLTPSITLHGAKVKGNSVLVTFRTSEPGTVTQSGAGLKSTTKALTGGSNQVSVPLSGAGRVDKRRHRKTRIEALLRVGPYGGHATITLRL
jgi:hypothetical protein